MKPVIHGQVPENASCLGAATLCAIVLHAATGGEGDGHHTMAPKTIRSAAHLYNPRGERLYLNDAECGRFLDALEGRNCVTRLLCLVLYFTGVRVSEALAIRHGDMQFESGIIAIRSLKKRGLHHVREVHVPLWLSMELERFMAERPSGARFFPVDRTTAWRQVTALMNEAGIMGAHACPKGLRHAFGVRAILASVPLPVLQKWMGHARMETTTIYTRVTGREERQLAEVMFGGNPKRP